MQEVFVLVRLLPMSVCDEDVFTVVDPQTCSGAIRNGRETTLWVTLAQIHDRSALFHIDADVFAKL